jgi:hypothetical protein
MSLGRMIGTWLLLAVAMTTNGIAREAVLVRLVGRKAADVLSAALGISIVLGLTRQTLHSLAGRSEARPARAALAWLLMTIAFECLIGRTVDHKSWRELADNYALWRGRLWPLVLATVVLSPFIWTRWWPRLAASDRSRR